MPSSLEPGDNLGHPMPMLQFMPSQQPIASSSQLPAAPQPERRKRPAPTAQNDEHDDENPQKRVRGKRKCWKCGDTSCLGRGGKALCPNSCSDCGEILCQGKDSRHAKKPCPTLAARNQLP